MQVSSIEGCFDRWSFRSTKERDQLKNRVSASRILHRAIITVTQELLLLSVRLQSCSFYNKLLFDRTDLPPLYGLWFERPQVLVPHILVPAPRAATLCAQRNI